MELMDEDLRSLMEKRLRVGSVRRHAPFHVMEAVDIMLQVGGGIRYLHELKIVHRDLKSHNILVRCLKSKEMETEYNLVKVADFGLSKIKKNNATYSEQTRKLGTTRWMAPEMMKGEGDMIDLKYPYMVDVFSFAMVCYEILTGKLPYSEVASSEVHKKVLAGIRPQLPEDCPSILKELIERCWNQDASKRPCFDDICAELRQTKCFLLVPYNIIVDIPVKEPADQSLRPEDGSNSGTSGWFRTTSTKSISGYNSSAEETSDAYNSIEHKPWVIGLDFGTTYSGFAYARVLDPDNPVINVCYDWPHKSSEIPKLYCKTSTELYYRRAAGPDHVECPSWGHLARSEYMDDRGNQHGAQGLYLSNFKLLLYKEYLDNPETSTKRLPSSLTATTVITDYLKQIGKFALTVVEEYAKGEEFNKDFTFSKDSVQWCVTVPSIWDVNAKEQMKACMVNAGLVSAEAGGIHVVLLPEAASFHCHQILRENHKDVSLNAMDKILVVDVGGGTVDIVVQELIGSGDTYKVKELTESSGGLCGGTFVDERFMKFFSKKIGCLNLFLREDYPSYKARLLKDWEEIKSAFGHELTSDTGSMSITFHHKLAAKWEAYEQERGNSIDDSSVVELTQQELKAIFDPVVDKILKLIDAQLTHVPNVKLMFVVGGFAGSPYLMQRIQSRFSGKVPHMVSPPSPGSAIVQGAVSLALHPDAIVSRISKKTYGTDVILSFDEKLDPSELQKFTNGKKYCKSRFDVFVRRGSRVEVNMDVMKEYRPHSNGQFQMLLDLYSSTEQDPRYTVGANVTKEGEFAVTLPENYRRRDMKVKLTMLFGRSSIDLKAEAQFQNGRGQITKTLKLPVEYSYQ